MSHYRIRLREKTYDVTAATRKEALDKIRKYVQDNPAPMRIVVKTTLIVKGRRRSISAEGATPEEASANLLALIKGAAA
jgi:hypothetical protein